VLIFFDIQFAFKYQITNLLKKTNPEIFKMKSENDIHTKDMNISFCYLKFSKYGIFSVFL